MTLTKFTIIFRYKNVQEKWFKLDLTVKIPIKFDREGSRQEFIHDLILTKFNLNMKKVQ